MSIEREAPTGWVADVMVPMGDQRLSREDRDRPVCVYPTEGEALAAAAERSRALGLGGFGAVPFHAACA